MRIAFIGTSHIGSLKTGWDALPADLKSGHEAVFIGFSAPSLSKQTHVGWLTKNNGIYPTHPSVRYFLEITSGSSDTPIKPMDYDVICFVDMFFCYDFSVIYAQQMGRVILVDDIPVSDYAYTKIIEQLLGESQYSNHPKVGDVPNNSQMWLLHEVIKLNQNLRVFLTPRPFMPSHRLKNKYHNWSDPNMVCRVASLFDFAVHSRLKDLGIVFLPRTKEQICPETGATPDHFSVGWIEEKKTYNEHMNSEYGKIIIKTIIELAGNNGHLKAIT